MAKAYWVDVSRLPPEEKAAVFNKVDRLAFLTQRRLDEHGAICAYIAFSERDEDFSSPENFKSLAGLPTTCTVTDVSDQDLTR